MIESDVSFRLLRAMRWPNIFMAALTMVLMYKIGQLSFFPTTLALSSSADWNLIILVSMLLTTAGSGYLINDYHDVKADLANKKLNFASENPKGMHALAIQLSAISIFLGLVLAYTSGQWWIVPANIMSIILSWIYTPHLKGISLLGNVVTAILVSLAVVFPLSFLYFSALEEPLVTQGTSLSPFWQFYFFYAFFAWYATMLREVVKDIEDLQGDQLAGYQSFPVRFGRDKAKILSLCMMLALLLFLVILDLYFWLIKDVGLALFGLLAVIFPLSLSFGKLLKSKQSKEFRQVSLWLKWTMLGGILSVIFI